jgi:aerobic-type carbon monoxide dehydrogenase small subunit (CoxS/CutS family)
MFHLVINGAEHTIEYDKKLMDYLRDDLRLCSVKDGCGEGACGACTVLVDGKPVKACVQKLSKFEGKSIVTVEGLSDREKEVYVYAFGKVGAVQCGFCIPGMVLAGKALIDGNPAPTREEVKKALRGNICRCTGYVKIEKAILLAAEIFRENKKPQPPIPTAGMSEPLPRVDVAEKVLGSGEFVDDIVLPGMLYAKALRTQYPRARVNRVDVSRPCGIPTSFGS